MKITKRQLRRIISEIGPPPDMSDPDWHPNMSQEWERRAQSEDPMDVETDAYETFTESLESIWNTALAAGIDTAELGEAVEELMANMGYEGKY
tara:strand:- start:93 stop:371 length:279 start_codon:yes stop_codon:yes gene_type:complete